MRVLSLDASTTCIGWSIWEDDNLLKYGKQKADKKLDWDIRIRKFAPFLYNLGKQTKIEKIYIEDVPLYEKGKNGGSAKGKSTLVKLGAIRGMVLTVAELLKVEVKPIKVFEWRKSIGINTGDKHRDIKKVKSIKLANELFNLHLNLVFTKSGRYSEDKSDDDISDSILLYASTRDKYRNRNRIIIENLLGEVV